MHELILMYNNQYVVNCFTAVYKICPIPYNRTLVFSTEELSLLDYFINKFNECNTMFESRELLIQIYTELCEHFGLKPDAHYLLSNKEMQYHIIFKQHVKYCYGKNIEA